jgi:hypothetical protein
MVAFLAQRPAASLEITGQKPSVSAILMDPISRLSVRARDRFPREGRKSRRRRRDKRADRPFAKIKKLFTKIKRLI